MRQVVKVNPSYQNKIDSLELSIEEAIRDKLERIANTAVNLSPVDTGSYVTSFSFSVGSGRPRGKSSDNKPKDQNVGSMRQEGLSNLMSDLNKITDLRSTTSITLRNGSPHATDVENGGPSWRRSGYKVFAQIGNIYG